MRNFIIFIFLLESRRTTNFSSNLGNHAQEAIMKSKAKIFHILALATAVLPITVSAHPWHTSSESPDFLAGLIHPFTSADHVLTLLTIGLLFSGSDKRSLSFMPLIFVAAMLLGGGLSLAYVEIVRAGDIVQGLVFSLIVLLASGGTLSRLVGIAMVAMIGFLHGQAHAYDIWLDVDTISFTAGFALTSGVILVAIVGLIRGLNLCLTRLFQPASDGNP